MRTYPPNSPQAAGRIVAMALLADGHLSNAELDTLDRLRVYTQLGLGRVELQSVIQEVCEDLLASMHLTWQDTCRVDERTLVALMGEIDDAVLRRKLTRICIALVECDSLITEGEAAVLGAAIDQWGLHREMFEPRADAYERLAG